VPRAGGFVNLGRVDAFDFIQLEYRVDGPLTLVLTSAAMAQYQAIFRFLLRTKHAAFSLRDVWRDLQVRKSFTYFMVRMLRITLFFDLDQTLSVRFELGQFAPELA
jgi:hypothetical protein